MKRIIFCVMLLAGVTAIGFAEHETWFSVGGAFGSYNMDGNEIEKSHLASAGVNLSFYSIFRQRNIGLFFNWGVLFPIVNNIRDDYKPDNQLDFVLVGVASSFTINDYLKLYFGIGPSVGLLLFSSDDNEIKAGSFILGLGVGGDVGIKFNLTDYMCITTGTTVAYQFAAYNDLMVTVNDPSHARRDIHSWVTNYSSIGFKPYLGFGFHFY